MIDILSVGAALAVVLTLAYAAVWLLRRIQPKGGGGPHALFLRATRSARASGGHPRMAGRSAAAGGDVAGDHPDRPRVVTGRACPWRAHRRSPIESSAVAHPVARGGRAARVLAG